MTSYRVKLRGAQKIIQIEAETLEEEDGGSLVAKDASGKVIGKFDQKQGSGWWIDQKSVGLAEEIRRGRERVKAGEEKSASKPSPSAR